MTISQSIAVALREAIARLQKGGDIKNFPADDIEVEIAQEEKFGDYTSNVALRYAAQVQMRPREFAELLCKEINASQKKNAVFSRVEVAGPGFLNFFLSEDYLRAHIANIAKASPGLAGEAKGGVNPVRADGRLRRPTSNAVNIEFLSANPTGQIQVGNARWGFYGDVLGNILEAAGYAVKKEYYINNAKTSNQVGELGKTALGEGTTYLTPHLEKKIRELGPKLKKIKGHAASSASRRAGRTRDDFAKAGFLLANAVQKDTAGMLAKKAGIRFDVWTAEQSLYEKDLLRKTLAFLKRKKLLYEKEGAVWLKTTQFGDDKDKVVVRSTGEFGYYLADIAYHRDKIARGYSTIIDVFGADHQGHVKPMEIAMNILGYKGQFAVLIGQLVQAKGGGKFSKRAGNTITLEELIGEVGIDAVRFFYLTRSLDTQMEFDIDLAREQSQKNPVYYVQYTHQRMASILRKARNKK